MSKTFGDADFSLSAISSNISVFVYSVTDSSVATLVESAIIIVGTGTTSVILNQAANLNFNASTSTMTHTVANGRYPWW